MKNPFATLHLRVRDARTKTAIPARLHIKRKDGSCYAPPSALAAEAGAIPAYLNWRDYRPNLHVCQAREQFATHLTSGEAHIPVPGGEMKIFVARGYERTPVVRTIQARPGETVHLDVDLDGTCDMPAQGWFSGDMHIHFTRTVQRDDDVLAHLMAAEDLYGVNNMVYKHFGEVQAPQRKMGHRGSHHSLGHSHQTISGAEEFRDDNLYGHMIAAGINKVIEPISVGKILGLRENYPLFSQVSDWTREQGGIAGWAHGGMLKLHESLPVEAALHKMDFVEGLQFNCFNGFYFWHRLLNCGLRMAITAGSDFPFQHDILAPWYSNLGLDRTYGFLGKNKPFSYSAYIESIRRGHNFATNGPLLFFEVEGKGPGAELQLDRNAGKVRVFARALAQYPLDRLEILANGAVVHMEDGKGGAREIAVETELPLGQSAWMAARVRGRVEPKVYGGQEPWFLHAHTSPTYVLRGGKPIASPADATWMADYIRLIEPRYMRSGVFKTAKQREALQRTMKQALAYYEGLLRR